VRRKEEQVSASGTNSAPNRLAFVAAQIVHDDVTRRQQRRNESLFDIGQEAVAVDAPVEHHRRIDPVVSAFAASARIRLSSVREPLSAAGCSRSPVP